jgi:hypothetical protein
MNIIDSLINFYEDILFLINQKKPSLVWLNIMNGEGIIGYKWDDKKQAYNKKHWNY